MVRIQLVDLIWGSQREVKGEIGASLCFEVNTGGYDYSTLGAPHSLTP